MCGNTTDHDINGARNIYVAYNVDSERETIWSILAFQKIKFFQVITCSEVKQGKRAALMQSPLFVKSRLMFTFKNIE